MSIKWIPLFNHKKEVETLRALFNIDEKWQGIFKNLFNGKHEQLREIMWVIMWNFQNETGYTE